MSSNSYINQDDEPLEIEGADGSVVQLYLEKGYGGAVSLSAYSLKTGVEQVLLDFEEGGVVTKVEWVDAEAVGLRSDGGESFKIES